MLTNNKKAALLAACPPFLRDANPDCRGCGSEATVVRVWAAVKRLAVGRLAVGGISVLTVFVFVALATKHLKIVVFFVSEVGVIFVVHLNPVFTSAPITKSADVV